MPDTSSSTHPSPAGTGADDAHQRHGERRRQLQAALHQTDAAIHAITSGDPQPYTALWDDSPDATLFGAWDRSVADRTHSARPSNGSAAVSAPPAD